MSNAHTVDQLHNTLQRRHAFAPVSNIQIVREHGKEALLDMQRAVALGLARATVISPNSCGLLVVQYRVFG